MEWQQRPEVHQPRLALARRVADQLVDDGAGHHFVAGEVVAAEAAGAGFDHRRTALLERAHDRADIVADQVGNAAGEYDEQIGFENLQAALDQFAQPVLAAEDNLALGRVGARRHPEAAPAATLIAIVEGERGTLLVGAAGAAMGDRNGAMNGAHRLHGAERADIAHLFDGSGIRHIASGITAFAQRNDDHCPAPYAPARRASRHGSA